MRYDQPQTGKQRGCYLKPLFRREDIDDPGQGFRHGTGVYRRIRGHADFRTLDHAPQSFRVSALAYEDYVRGCSCAVARGCQKGSQMLRDRALGDRPTGIRDSVKIKFNGGFIGADVSATLFNDIPQDSGQEGGLA